MGERPLGQPRRKAGEDLVIGLDRRNERSFGACQVDGWLRRVQSNDGAGGETIRNELVGVAGAAPEVHDGRRFRREKHLERCLAEKREVPGNDERLQNGGVRRSQALQHYG